MFLSLIITFVNYLSCGLGAGLAIAYYNLTDKGLALDAGHLGPSPQKRGNGGSKMSVLWRKHSLISHSVSTRLAISVQTKQRGERQGSSPCWSQSRTARAGVREVMSMKNTVIGRRFNPDGYGMIYCPACKGSGKLSNGVEAGVVCKVCGGFGFVKKHKSSLEERVQT